MPLLPSYRNQSNDLLCKSRIKTSQLICFANRLTGFYMEATLAFNGLNASDPSAYYRHFLTTLELHSFLLKHRSFGSRLFSLEPLISHGKSKASLQFPLSRWSCFVWLHYFQFGKIVLYDEVT